MLIEDKGRRTAGSAHFYDGENFVANCYGGHIHYFNKNAVGDGVIGWRKIDTTLFWNEEKKGWFFEYHSFFPFLPEYADDWVEFTDNFGSKQQTIKYKAQCNHVKGELLPSLEGITEQNCVLYPDAFGEGIDFILYFTSSSLRKVVRIREGYAFIEDLDFLFEVQFPEECKCFRGEEIENISYELLLDTSKELDTDKQTFIGNSGCGDKDWATYLKPFQVWDSTGISEVIKVDFIVEGGKYFLKKKLPLNFLTGAIGDVFTDVTTSYYGSVGDGVVVSPSSSNWGTVRGSASGTPNYTSTTGAIYTAVNSLQYSISRGYFVFDTSALPPAPLYKDASFSIFVNSETHTLLGTVNSNVYFLNSNQISPEELISGDFDSLDLSNHYGTSSTSTLSIGSYNTFPALTGIISKIIPGGYSKLAITTYSDFNNVAPTLQNATKNELVVCFSEYAGRQPYLSITYNEEQPADFSYFWNLNNYIVPPEMDMVTTAGSGVRITSNRLEPAGTDSSGLLRLKTSYKFRDYSYLNTVLARTKVYLQDATWATGANLYLLDSNNVSVGYLGFYDSNSGGVQRKMSFGLLGTSTQVWEITPFTTGTWFTFEILANSTEVTANIYNSVGALLHTFVINWEDSYRNFRDIANVSYWVYRADAAAYMDDLELQVTYLDTNHSPVIDAGTNKPAQKGQEFKPLSDTTFTDTDGWVEHVYYQISGEVTDWVEILQGDYSTLQEAVQDFSYTFQNSGNIIVTVKAVDNYSAEAEDTVTIAVDDYFPVVDAGNDKITQKIDELVLFLDSDFYGILNEVSIARYKVIGEMEDWVEIPQESYPTLLEAVQAVSYKFNTTGEITVSLQVEDSFGLLSEDSFIATVINEMPIVDAGSDKTIFSIINSTPFSDSSFSDTDSTITNAYYKIEGEVVDWVEIPKGSYGTLLEAVNNFIYNFTLPGEKLVFLKVLDSDLGAAVDSFTATVKEYVLPEVLTVTIIEDSLSVSIIR